MTYKPFAGKDVKVAVVIESQYIPGEIKIYQELFTKYGATVHLVSRLWGQTKQSFYSTVEPGVQNQIETIDVSLDFDQVNLDDYDAVIVSANYTSVRLRWSEREDVTTGNAAEVAHDVPAAQFIRRAMENPRIIKGMPCHALWLLTPSPEVLTGRKVICNKVVLADVLNAGAIYTPCPPGTPPDKQVVVDRDLVTNNSWLASTELVDRIKDLILNPPKQEANGSQPAVPVKPSRKNILVVLSEWGFWGEELIGPLEVFNKAGYTTSFCTPRGRRPRALPPSMDPSYIDPPLGRSVTSPEMAEKVKAIDALSNTALDNPRNLSTWFPERPYWSQVEVIDEESVVLRKWEQYYKKRGQAQRDATSEFDALLIVGGSGPMIDLVNNWRVHDLILGFLEADKPIAAECYGVACLAQARNYDDRKSIIWGKHVTGHAIEYDYKDGTGVLDPETGEILLNRNGNFVNLATPFYTLEYMLRDAVGPEGQFHGNVGKETSVIVDYPFITGRSTPDSTLTGEMLVKLLETGQPRQWGWTHICRNDAE